MIDSSLGPYEVKDPEKVKFIDAIVRSYDPSMEVWVSKDIISQLHAGDVYAYLLTKGYVIERGDHTHFRVTKGLIDNVKMLFEIK